LIEIVCPSPFPYPVKLRKSALLRSPDQERAVRFFSIHPDFLGPRVRLTTKASFPTFRVAKPNPLSKFSPSSIRVLCSCLQGVYLRARLRGYSGFPFVLDKRTGVRLAWHRDLSCVGFRRPLVQFFEKVPPTGIWIPSALLLVSKVRTPLPLLAPGSCQFGSVYQRKIVHLFPPLWRKNMSLHPSLLLFPPFSQFPKQSDPSAFDLVGR